MAKKAKVDAYCIDRYEFPGPGKLPRTGVSWFQAKALCEARGRRLCTAVEWERACKGPRSYRYPYGNTFKANKCATEDSNEEPRAVVKGGAFKGCRSGYGAFDLSGNVAEWTAEKVLKGGSSKKPDYAVRCAHRAKKSPGSSDPFVGFRCCADAE